MLANFDHFLKQADELSLLQEKLNDWFPVSVCQITDIRFYVANFDQFQGDQ